MIVILFLEKLANIYKPIFQWFAENERQHHYIYVTIGYARKLLIVTDQLKVREKKY